LKRNWLTILLIAVLAVAIGLTGYWGYQQAQARERMEIAAENQYKRAFHEVVQNVEGLEADTAKARVITSPEQSVRILSDIWRKAFAAQQNYGQLPIPQLGMSKVDKFFTQLTDFSYILAVKVAGGHKIDAEEQALLKQFHEQATQLNEVLNRMKHRVDEDNINWRELDELSSAEMKKTGAKYLVDGFNYIEKQLGSFPTIVYDGPFSDHIRKDPKGLTGPKVTQAQAAAIARDFIGRDLAKEYNVEKAGDGEGIISAYSFQLTPKNKQRHLIAMDISKKGGHVIWMLQDREVGKVKITVDQAEARAARFLREKGFPAMVLTSITEYNGMTLFSYAYEQDGIIIYPDFVKVQVAMDNGEILAFDATGYLMAHHQRKLPSPKLSVEAAAKALPEGFKVSRDRLALIPLETQVEVLTYEFTGTFDGEQFLIYVNTETGEQERILRVVQTKEGKLTI